MNEKGLSVWQNYRTVSARVGENHGERRTLRANQWQTDATRRRSNCAALKLEITGELWKI